jgi:hypothetical protein
VCVFTGDQDEDKVGECPSVRNDTGICLQNCTYDKECAGNQKCCSNGCGHMCVEPVSKFILPKHHNPIPNPCTRLNRSDVFVPYSTFQC